MKLKLISRDCKNLRDFCGLRVWQKPKEGSAYALGVDVAEGVGGDASCISVIDCGTGMHVASYWNNLIDTDNFAVEIYKLGNWYNRGFICIEANNHGHAVISQLGGSLGGLAYPNLYKRITYNEYTQKRTKTIGFDTKPSTKPFLIENLKSALKMGDLVTFDRYTIQELGSFVRDVKTGRLSAQGNSKDDRVMALALAWEQARLIRDGQKVTHEKDLPSLKFDPHTGFPLSDSYETPEVLF